MITQDFETTYKKLMDQASRGERGNLEKVSLLEKAINMADLLKNDIYQRQSRMKYVEAAIDARMPEKAMTAYSFLLKTFDEKSDSFRFYDKMQLLWRYKWILGYLTDFPTIPKSKIEDALADMKKRYVAGDYSLEPVYHYHYTSYAGMGDFDTAEKHFEKCQQESRGMMSDCDACGLMSKVDFLILKGEDEQAVDMSQPILTGKKSCRTIPNQFYHLLFIPLVRLGKMDEALKYAKKIKTKPVLEFLAIHAERIKLKTIQGKLTPALKIFETNLTVAMESLSKYKPFQFYLGGQLLFKKLQQQGKTTVKLALGTNFPLYQEDHQYQVDEILNWLNQEVETLTNQFNTRNGNEFYSELVARNEALLSIRPICN